MSLIDSHCHLEMLDDAGAAVERAREAGVEQVVSIGIDLPTGAAIDRDARAGRRADPRRVEARDLVADAERVRLGLVLEARRAVCCQPTRFVSCGTMRRFSTPPGVTATSNERRRLQMSFVMTRSPTLSGVEPFTGTMMTIETCSGMFARMLRAVSSTRICWYGSPSSRSTCATDDEVARHVVQAVQQLARLDADDVVGDGVAILEHLEAQRLDALDGLPFGRGVELQPRRRERRARSSPSRTASTRTTATSASVAPALPAEQAAATTPKRPAIPTRLRTAPSYRRFSGRR